MNFKKHGTPPYKVAVIHGGPGACGEMRPVAVVLAHNFGVLEPIQTASTLQGQVDELKSILEEHGDPPITLVGFSWGAWLSYIVAANHPELIHKLILIGSGPFEEVYSGKIQEARINRLNEKEKTEFESLLSSLNTPSFNDKKVLLSKLGPLVLKTDSYDPIVKASKINDGIDFRGNSFQSVWAEAAALRRSGNLLELGKQIVCPVTAIHGDYDPHPVDGVTRPLSMILEHFQWILLEKCGHKPWIERHAKEYFFRVLKEQIFP